MLVLPTGAGKTAIAGFYIGEELEQRKHDRVLVLQHTDELIDQNRSAIRTVTGMPTSVVKAEQDDWDGRIVFGSVQTLARANRRERMAPVSHLVIDECHRSAAQSYQSIIDEARALNPEIKLLGLSATPGRGDGRRHLGNCARPVRPNCRLEHRSVISGVTSSRGNEQRPDC